MELARKSAGAGKISCLAKVQNIARMVGQGGLNRMWSTPKVLVTVSMFFQAVGDTVVLEEKFMDAVTGLSGSGPGYVFAMINALADGGVKVGLPKPVALKLAAQTVYGAAKMLIETGEHPIKLRDMVTSPGGTTITGLHSLERDRLGAALMNAVEAATQRSKELGKS
jgi:pyrroline-5-carboxylate reductase